MKKIVFTPIGIVHSEFKHPRGTPIQAASPLAQGTEGYIEIFPEYIDGLKDLDGFSHIILLYYFHKAGPYRLLRKPFMDNEERGIFSIRAPSRPNPIGISIVKLIEVKEGGKLIIQDLDILDGTPLLDIKPYLPAMDSRNVERIGWLKKRIHNMGNTTDDGRFA
ncbi:MAG: tRNA (N6-threonylcarbamoyladenosine(37)-N6)-methyltransferase TrmO [Candidatus Hodarchaeota archaeon]